MDYPDKRTLDAVYEHSGLSDVALGICREHPQVPASDVHDYMKLVASAEIAGYLAGEAAARAAIAMGVAPLDRWDTFRGAGASGSLMRWLEADELGAILVHDATWNISEAEGVAVRDEIHAACYEFGLELESAILSTLLDEADLSFPLPDPAAWG